MKNSIKFLSIAFVFGAFFASCEGPEGPAGEDGMDGNLSCLECHATTKMDAINAEFAAHPHASGSSWARGTSTSCSQCHSSQGYLTYIETGKVIAGNGAPLTCETCHSNHASLEDDIDAPVREVGDVASVMFPPATYSHGAGNLCATCHQANHKLSEYDEFTADETVEEKFTGDDIALYQAHGAFGPAGTATLVGDTLFVTFDIPVATHKFISSTHAGPHHGPQANMFAADMGTQSGTPWTRTGHTDCSGCHLNDTTEAGGFGHAFEPDINQCNDCHGTAVDIAGIQAGFQARMDAIETALEAAGALHIDDEGELHGMYASLEADVFNAWWNYMCIWEDKSTGIHNRAYTETLLTLAENALGL